MNVGIEYVAKEGSTKPVLIQKLAPVTTHEAVEKLDDGSWLIKNTAVEVGEDVVDGYANKILVDVVSESGSPVEGTQITMTCPNGDKKTYETGDIIDLEELGMVGSYSLQQTKSIAGHNIAEEKYVVTVSQKDGRYIVKVENIKLGLLDKIFGNNKIPHGPDGEWMMTFVNVRKTAKIELTCEVAMNFGAGTWHDLAFEKQCKEDTKYEFVLSWDDGHKREEEAATLVNGSKHNFDLEVPYGVEYRIVCLNEKGYFETSFPAGPKNWVIGDSELKEKENMKPLAGPYKMLKSLGELMIAAGHNYIITTSSKYPGNLEHLSILVYNISETVENELKNNNSKKHTLDVIRKYDEEVEFLIRCAGMSGEYTVSRYSISKEKNIYDLEEVLYPHSAYTKRQELLSQWTSLPSVEFGEFASSDTLSLRTTLKGFSAELLLVDKK